MITPDPMMGTLLHALGACAAAVCYTPQKKVQGWSWQSYWLVQASFCWLLLPILGAVLTIPHLGAVLREADSGVMLKVFALGAAYGIGGTAFGIAIRHIGFSLTYAIAVGLSSVLGTLLPPLVAGTLGANLAKPGGDWVLAGVLIGALGILLCGAAGHSKEKDLGADGKSAGFSLAKGLLLSLLAGVLSAVYGFALAAGAPIAEIAATHGAGHWQGNVVFIFANTGAFLTTALYCLFLHHKDRSLGELVELPAGEEKASLPLNFSMAALTGLLWYGQFFFYNLGHVRMGDFGFSSWAIHMIMLVLISCLLGLTLREWSSCRRGTKLGLAVAVSVLIAAVLVLTQGNRIGDEAGKKKTPEATSSAEGRAGH
ncbi:MAG: hypothetical protein RL095_489 [Verrucomicrobiota bacterium]|jgi:L-rhamnose-H+ transport protein